MAEAHTFIRAQLHELVWLTPMMQLASQYGISGTGLAKVCRKFDIPVPGRGYWNKFHAGHKVSKTPLPAAKSRIPNQITIRPLGPRQDEPVPAPIPETVAVEIETARRKVGVVVVADTLAKPHPLVDAWVQEDRRDRKQNRWYAEREPIDGTELGKRRLRISSTLFKSLERLGYGIIVGENRFCNVHIANGRTKLELELRERVAHVRRMLTVEEKAKRTDMSPGQRWTQLKVPTGELLVKVKAADFYLSKEWRETAETPLEGMLDNIIAEVAGLFEEVRIEEQRRADEEKRRYEAEKLRRAEEFERKRERIRVRRLLQQSEDWRTALAIRSFVAAVEGSAKAQAQQTFDAWKSWALATADDFDPLRDEDLMDLTVSDLDVHSFKE